MTVFFSALDNIALTAVPVPAAAWLFGSALAGLGWIRRRSAGDALPTSS
ncbi:MAG: VPLPA-CTERM sorting domain-containing protein [Gammaproteobacteria bacterium]|nr:VPLPA-CTERM sorting domain-containing protein [Gammaproteobacteria bacterium]MDP7093017.1 VPLPA-CTERM sorting domain-containing protein [Gammaproteobacteria bacterium]MDP7270486.1 VPLPA-CTERM sorting domain-containing protein [Gammaproteobacteria bacterium]HJP04021.1 VPLPA-CTERM sorting domain-containing protein [Gammaproteobacteria bacterium]